MPAASCDTRIERSAKRSKKKKMGEKGLTTERWQKGEMGPQETRHRALKEVQQTFQE